VSYERDRPANRGGRDPEVSVVVALVERVTDHPTLIAKLGDGLDGVDVDREDARSPDEPCELFRASRTPCCLQRPIPRLGDGLRGEGDPLPEEVLRVLGGQRRALTQTGCEDVRVD
jgi:hypothetical protein